MSVNYETILQVARLEKPAELVIRGGKVVNVFSGEIYPGGIAAVGDRIAAIGEVEEYIGPDTRVIEAGGGFITPGLIDGHVHIESSMLSITRFAELALRRGITSVMSDIHEVAVVGGLEAVREVLQEAEQALLKVYFVIPSHVPFSPGMETTGGVIGPEEVRQALEFNRCAGLSEIVVSSALGKEERLWKAMEIVREAGGLLHGHGPFTYGADLAAFAALGIQTDHESFTVEDAAARLRAGIHLQIRQGSAAESIPELVKVITEQEMDPSNISVITDDILAEDLFTNGYQDVNIRVLQEHGIDPLTAVQMVTLNAARAFHLEQEIGVLAPGRQADAVIVDDLTDFLPRTVLARGEVVLLDGELVFDFPDPSPTASQVNSIRLQTEISPWDLSSLVECSLDWKRAQVHVLDTPVEIPVPELVVKTVPVESGAARPDPGQDLAAIAVAERHQRTGNLSLAFARGFGLKKGALASSVAHDHHNIVGIGTSYQDLAFAINAVAGMQGGQVVAADGKIIASVALPILGLMSPRPVEEVCQELRELTSAARELGCEMRWPHMFLSFMTCSGGPGYSMTDMGLLDGYKGVFLPVVIGRGE